MAFAMLKVDKYFPNFLHIHFINGEHKNPFPFGMVKLLLEHGANVDFEKIW